jgi:hypothetical protein
MGRIRMHLTYANVMVTVLAFVVLGGATALGAFVVSSNSQIAPGTVSGHKPPSGAHANIIRGSVNGSDLATGAVGTGKIATGSINTPKLKNDAVTGPKIADNSVDPNAVVDPNRSVNLPLASFVNESKGTTLGFGPNPNDGTTPNFALVNSRLVLEWNDNSAGPADKDSVETTFTVPPDYASGGQLALRISKDGTDTIERVAASAAVNEGSFSATAPAPAHASITTAPLTTYTLTATDAVGTLVDFSAGDTVSFRFFIDDGNSGTTAQDKVRVHSVAFLYKATQ